MCSSHQSHPWFRLCSRKRSSCCSIVCVWACRWVETRTYMATFISALLGERSCWKFLQTHCTPLDKIVIAPIPSVWSVGTLNRVTLNHPLPFLHVYPAFEQHSVLFPSEGYSTARATTSRAHKGNLHQESRNRPVRLMQNLSFVIVPLN